MVSTAKEGLLKAQSTVVLELPLGQLEPRRPVAKIIYTPSLRASDRLQVHEVICKALDAYGDQDGLSLGNAIDRCVGFLKERGLVADGVNIAS